MASGFENPCFKSLVAGHSFSCMGYARYSKICHSLHRIFYVIDILFFIETISINKDLIHKWGYEVATYS